MPALKAAQLAQRDAVRTLTARLHASHQPCVELTAAQQQPAVLALQASLRREVLPGVAPERRAAVSDLLAHVGQPDFYERLAVHQPGDAARWQEMARVQRQFAAAEPGYDTTTRAYSESMRLTLHAAALQHFARGDTVDGQPLYDHFIELHPTAFHENGGWVDNLQIPISGAMAVARATPPAMLSQVATLVDGNCLRDAPTVKAAALVREARTQASVR